MDQTKIINFFPTKSSTDRFSKENSYRSSEAFHLFDLDEEHQSDDEQTENKSVSFYSFRVLQKDRQSFQSTTKSRSNNTTFCQSQKPSVIDIFNRSNIYLNIPEETNPSNQLNAPQLVKRNLADYFEKKGTQDQLTAQTPNPGTLKRRKTSGLLNWLIPKRQDQPCKM